MFQPRSAVRIILLLLLLFGFAISAHMPDTHEELDASMAFIAPEVDFVDPREAELYYWRQRELKAAIQAYFDKAIAAGDIVGAGVSIVKGDSVVISEGFGNSRVDTGQKADANTIFRLGSLSKGFAGILAAKLVEEGKLDRNDKVKDYFPEFQLGDRSNTERITLENLLSHTSGAPYHSYTNLIEAGLSLDHIIGRFKDVEPISAPGSLYSYQNALFALSGEIMHKATGEDITESLKNRFFNALGMCSTIMDHESLQDADNVALPHVKWRRGWRSRKLNDHYYNAVAAGGINASAMDMAKWMRFLLGHNPEIMNTSSLEEAFKPVVEIKGRSKYYQRWPGHISSHYGLGWRIHKFREALGDAEKTIWHHGGSVNNFRNEIALYPESDLGICVLLNSYSRLASKVIPDLYNIISEVYQSSQVEVASMHIPE